MMTHVILQDDADEDIQYLKEKLVITTDKHSKQKLEKQIALLEDAIVIYCLTGVAE